VLGNIANSTNDASFELNPEPAALPRSGFHAIFATHPFHRFAHNRQPDTRTFEIRSRMQPPKELKNPLVLRRITACLSLLWAFPGPD